MGSAKKEACQSYQAKQAVRKQKDTTRFYIGDGKRTREREREKKTTQTTQNNQANIVTIPQPYSRNDGFFGGVGSVKMLSSIKYDD